MTARLSTALFTVPAVVYLGVLSFLPLGWFLLRSVRTENGDWSLASYEAFFEQGAYVDVLWRTLLLSMLTAAIAVLIAYPVALAIRRAGRRGQILLLAAVVLPYLTSVLVRTFAWAELLALEGPVNDVLLSLGFLDEPQLIGKSRLGTVIGLVHILCPTAVLAIWATMTGIDDRLERVAMGLGASRLRAFWTTFFPLSVRGIWAGASLVFVLSLGAFVIPAVLGGLDGLMFGQVVVEQATVLLNWPLASAMTVLFLVALVVPLALASLIRRVLRRHRREIPVGADLRWRASSRVGRALDAVPSRLATWAARAFAGLVLVFLIVPEVIVVILSFGPADNLSWPPERLTTEGYSEFAASEAWTSALARSVWFALGAASIATALGGLAAYALARNGVPRLGWLLALLVLPLAMPEIVPAISYYIFATELDFSGTVAAIVLAQAVTGIGLVAIVVRARLLSLDPDLELAARVSGASRLRAIRDVVAPLAAPAIAVGFVYALLHAFDNLIVTLFVAGTHETLPIRVWLQLVEVTSPLIAVAASIMIAAVLVLAAATLLVTRRRVDVVDQLRRG